MDKYNFSIIDYLKLPISVESSKRYFLVGYYLNKDRANGLHRCY